MLNQIVILLQIMATLCASLLALRMLVSIWRQRDQTMTQSVCTHVQRSKDLIELCLMSLWLTQLSISLFGYAQQGTEYFWTVNYWLEWALIALLSALHMSSSAHMVAIWVAKHLMVSIHKTLYAKFAFSLAVSMVSWFFVAIFGVLQLLDQVPSLYQMVALYLLSLAVATTIAFYSQAQEQEFVWRKLAR